MSRYSWSSVDTSMTFFEIALKNKHSFMIGAPAFGGGDTTQGNREQLSHNDMTVMGLHTTIVELEFSHVN